MQSVSIRSAYQIQKKILNKSKINCFKVGASNYSSAKFFCIDGIVLGGLPPSNIFFDGCTKDYPIAELELVVKIKFDKGIKDNYQILAKYIGIECPLIEVENPHGNVVLAIADNCSAGNLILISNYTGNYTEAIKVFINGIELVQGGFSNLRFSIDEIIKRSLSIIIEYDLPCESEIYIATGGLTETFALTEQDHIEVCYE